MKPSHPPEQLQRAMGDDGPAGPLPLSPAAELRMQAWLRARVMELPAARRQQQKQRLRRTGLAAGVLLSAAATLALIPWADPSTESTADLQRWQLQPIQGGTLTWTDGGGAAHALRSAGMVSAPGRLQTDGAASARLVTPQGVQLRMGPSTGLRPLNPVAGRREIDLERGEVDVQVPRLKPGESFAIHALDTTAIVHGTRFKVSLITDGGGRRTCVRVQEGRVEVRGPVGARLLGAGDVSGCAGRPAGMGENPPQPPPTAAGAGPPGSMPKPRVHRRVRRGPRPEAALPEPPPASSGQLMQQNRLLSQALAAEREGELEQARRAFERLLAEHPTSPLAPDARRGLARIGQRGSR